MCLTTTCLMHQKGKNNSVEKLPDPSHSFPPLPTPNKNSSSSSHGRPKPPRLMAPFLHLSVISLSFLRHIAHVVLHWEQLQPNKNSVGAFWGGKGKARKRENSRRRRERKKGGMDLFLVSRTQRAGMKNLLVPSFLSDRCFKARGRGRNRSRKSAEEFD